MGELTLWAVRDLCKFPQLASCGVQSPHSSPRHHILRVNNSMVGDLGPFCLNSTHSPFWFSNLIFLFESHQTPILSPCASLYFGRCHLTQAWAIRAFHHPGHKVRFRAEGGECDSRLMRYHPGLFARTTGREKPLFNSCDY